MARILLIEQDALLAKQYAGGLKADGHQVRIARDAQTAIAHADESKPDIIVLEIVLAGHGGIEFLYEFRSYQEWRNVPIIILSRLHRSKYGVTDTQLDRLGITGFLYKPDVSLNRLRHYLKARLSTDNQSNETP